jgi:hypothetical protein
MSSLTWLKRARKLKLTSKTDRVGKIVRRFRWFAILVAVSGTGLFALGEPHLGTTALGCAALYFAVETRFWLKDALRDLKELLGILREIRSR